MNRTKLFIVFVLGFLALIVAGCGGGGSSTATSNTTSTTTHSTTTTSNANTTSQAAELVTIQEELAANGAKWIAGDNPIFSLPEEEKAKLAGTFKIDSVTTQTTSRTSRAITTAIPSSFDWRSTATGNFVTEVKYQDHCGSCWAFAATAALESSVLINNPGQFGPDFDLSEQMMLSCSDGDCGGGSLAMAADYLYTTGISYETCYNYIAANGSCNNKCPDWESNVFHIDGWRFISRDSLKEYLFQYGPVVASIDIYSDFYAYMSGIYAPVSSAVQYDKCHAVLVVGYDDAAQCLIIKNSWGNDWGEGGYFRLSYDAFDIINALVVFQSQGEISEPTTIVLTSPNVSQSFNSESRTYLTWSTTGAFLSDRVVISMKRGSVAADVTVPDNVNWYRFTEHGASTSNDGHEIVTIPPGLTEANDWRFYVRIEAADVWDASDASFTYVDGTNDPDRDKDGDGYSENAGDCDDTNANINPGTTWFQDVDGDGYTNGTMTGFQCARPAGYYYLDELASPVVDCNDADATIHPGATDVANDGIDQDCVGGDAVSSTPGTVTSAGQVWMDRNLGASQVATSFDDAEAYGDLYQWGRGTDGHEKRDSPTTSTLSTSDTPGHGNFITGYSYPHDWRSPNNDTLWQGVSGINNPCPAGFRLPTVTEWEVEVASWSWDNRRGAFASPLKLVSGPSRNSFGQTYYAPDPEGNYWSSSATASNTGYYARCLAFYTRSVRLMSSERASGKSVRCIQD
ncbi:MAG: hypothetical protein KJ950_05595 [Proteobacteria bacterium]|nr:hypothetical protein [Pseudomonadota bacterium]MBU1687386.1 hypothetical protein [Pseudomonadota bacterium]